MGYFTLLYMHGKAIYIVCDHQPTSFAKSNLLVAGKSLVLHPPMLGSLTV